MTFSYGHQWRAMQEDFNDIYEKCVFQYRFQRKVCFLLCGMFTLQPSHYRRVGLVFKC